MEEQYKYAGGDTGIRASERPTKQPALPGPAGVQLPTAKGKEHGSKQPADHVSQNMWRSRSLLSSSSWYPPHENRDATRMSKRGGSELRLHPLDFEVEVEFAMAKATQAHSN